MHAVPQGLKTGPGQEERTADQCEQVDEQEEPLLVMIPLDSRIPEPIEAAQQREDAFPRFVAKGIYDDNDEYRKGDQIRQNGKREHSGFSLQETASFDKILDEQPTPGPSAEPLLQPHNRTSYMAELIPDPQESAEAAGLRYVSDEMPGITRKRAGKGFAFFGPRGDLIRDPKTIERIKKLVIPPAWTNVWICPHPRGHIQATARDAKGRKQYRYHDKWREVRDETKYSKLLAFARKLPEIRERIDRDMRKHGLPREKVLATVVRLLETGMIRVGNSEYKKTNESFGLTTIHNEHVEVTGETLRFQFRGKGGKQIEVDYRDRRAAGVVKRCQELPGQELFEYIDESGQTRDVTSEDVNAYIQEIAGEEFTAKDFRTWAGTVHAIAALREFEPAESQTQIKRNVVQAIKRVAHHLGNTVAISRKCYIHPAAIEAYMTGDLHERLKAEEELAAHCSGLNPEEIAALALLQAGAQGDDDAEKALKKAS
jgi:DNA topoisomerase I